MLAAISVSRMSTAWFFGIYWLNRKMGFKPPLVTLTTDFGWGSYVAQMKGVILGHAPSAHFIDVTHDIEPQNILQASIVLAEAIPSFPSHAIHLAVVDPGVGSQRAILYFEIGNWRLVMPDNGLITGLAEQYPIHRVFELNQRQYWSKSISPTFHGRDIMSHVVGHLCNGLAPEAMGDPAKNFKKLPVPEPVKHADSIVGRIQFIDHFGNAISNISRSSLKHLFVEKNFDTRCLKVDIQNVIEGLPLLESYFWGNKGQVIALLDSQDRVEIAVVEGNAADKLLLRIGQEVVVRTEG